MNDTVFDGLLIGFDISSGDPATKQSNVTIRLIVTTDHVAGLTEFLHDTVGIVGKLDKVGRFSLRWEHEWVE